VSDPQPRDERPVVIFGAGQLALQAWYRLRENGREVCAFVVDDSRLSRERTLRELPIVAFSNLFEDYPPDRCEMFVAVGYRRMRSRRDAYQRMRAAGYRCVNAISSRAIVDVRVELGDNNLVFPGCIVESDVSIGCNNVFWSGATLCHDSRIGDHNFLAPRTIVAGNCSVEDLCFFGVASVCIDGLSVRSETYLRAGAVLLSSSERLGKYGGNPAVKLGYSDPQSGIQIGRIVSA
jgi:sugar O-acyltransferase (sialic acid O-acetyltransferase NeuD family)